MKKDSELSVTNRKTKPKNVATPCYTAQRCFIFKLRSRCNFFIYFLVRTKKVEKICPIKMKYTGQHFFGEEPLLESSRMKSEVMIKFCIISNEITLAGNVLIDKVEFAINCWLNASKGVKKSFNFFKFSLKFARRMLDIIHNWEFIGFKF